MASSNTSESAGQQKRRLDRHNYVRVKDSITSQWIQELRQEEQKLIEMDMTAEDDEDFVLSDVSIDSNHSTVSIDSRASGDKHENSKIKYPQSYYDDLFLNLYKPRSCYLSINLETVDTEIKELVGNDMNDIIDECLDEMDMNIVHDKEYECLLALFMSILAEMHTRLFFILFVFYFYFYCYCLFFILFVFYFYFYCYCLFFILFVFYFVCFLFQKK